MMPNEGATPQPLGHETPRLANSSPAGGSDAVFDVGSQSLGPRSQSRSVLSLEPEAMCRPSGLNVTNKTALR